MMQSLQCAQTQKCFYPFALSNTFSQSSIPFDPNPRSFHNPGVIELYQTQAEMIKLNLLYPRKELLTPKITLITNTGIRKFPFGEQAV